MKTNIYIFDHISMICGNKMPTICNRGFIVDLIACSTCFGHHYAHHQELKSDSTDLITNLDNTRYLILRTQILPNLQITFYIVTARNTTGSNHCIILLSS